MSTYAKLVEHSISPAGAELVTFELTYPYFVHAQILTHRKNAESDSDQYEEWAAEWLEFSASSASNRALPVARLIDAILRDPVIPTFKRTTRGMTAGEVLDGTEQEEARRLWLEGMDNAIATAQALQALKVHKQWANRVLYPYQHITTVATANRELWEHFFGLRDHAEAQDEMRDVAHKAKLLLARSYPNPLGVGEWHLPYVTREECRTHPIETQLDISVARTASTSYLRQNDVRALEDDLELAKRLLTSDPPHARPFEHQAWALLDAHERSGNFLGFGQHRKLIGL